MIFDVDAEFQVSCLHLWRTYGALVVTWFKTCQNDEK